MSSGEHVDLRIVRLPHAANLPLPEYQSALAAGLDLLAAVPANAPVALAPGGPCDDPNRHRHRITPPAMRARSGRGRVWRSAMVSPSSTRPAPSMPTTEGELQVILVNIRCKTRLSYAAACASRSSSSHRYDTPNLSNRRAWMQPSVPPAVSVPRA